MVTSWTTEQILALAPDTASAKNGKGLATLSKWGTLGHALDPQLVIWGECQGSGKDPYRVQIDLKEPAFRCSCPSRKFPCKHGLALFLLLVAQSTAFTESTPPDWVIAWLDSRSKREEKQQQKSQQPDKPIDAIAQAKRATQRHTKVTAGVEELQQWLQDLVRQGLAAVQSQPYSFWERPATRMIDAQAPGLARQLRDLAGIPYTGSGWTDKLLVQLGRLYLLLEGYQRLEALPAGVQADIRRHIGMTLTQDEVLAAAPQGDILTVQDNWLVLGQCVEEEEKLRSRRTWLWGQTSQRPALLLQFAYGRQPFEAGLLLGTAVAAELAFYPSAFPLRALVKQRQDVLPASETLPGFPTIKAAIAQYSGALVADPWLERVPMQLQAVLFLQTTSGWIVQDTAGHSLPVATGFEHAWQILALSGGHPLTLFGEWNDQVLFPLSVWVNNQFYGF
jgi:hypothetical protein